jgi:hypothetical protein
MEALRKIVTGSDIDSLFSLPYSSRAAKYEVIVLPMPAENEYRHGKARHESITEFLRGTVGDVEFVCTRELTPDRGTAVEIFD